MPKSIKHKRVIKSILVICFILFFSIGVFLLLKATFSPKYLDVIVSIGYHPDINKIVIGDKIDLFIKINNNFDSDITIKTIDISIPEEPNFNKIEIERFQSLSSNMKLLDSTSINTDKFISGIKIIFVEVYYMKNNKDYQTSLTLPLELYNTEEK